jgi:hypothetical protein
MAHIKKGIPKLRKAAQPPLSYPGATADADRAKKPSLAESPANDQDLNPGDRVVGLGTFGKPTRESGTVERANDENAVVKWDDDDRIRLAGFLPTVQPRGDDFLYAFSAQMHGSPDCASGTRYLALWSISPIANNVRDGYLQG